VKGLFEGEIAVPPPPPPVGTAPTAGPGEPATPVFETSAAAFERSRRGPRRHVFDLVLQFARGQLTPQFIDLTAKLFTLGGHYGLYLAMAALLLFHLMVGVKTGQVNTVLLGVTEVVILVVLQYAASRFSVALGRLNRSTPARMSSTAFLDCCALLAMFCGLVALLGLTIVAVETQGFSLILPAIAAFILCEYVAILALNPEALKLTIAPETTAGEEAVGVLSFLLKSCLQLAPVAFGVGVVGGTLALLYAVFLMFMPPEGREGILAFLGPERFKALAASVDSASLDQAMRLWPAQETASKARMILIGSAALPLVTYVLFLVCYLLVDVLRAILAIRGKPDEFRSGDENSEG
jgi:hypothetical protein